MATAPKTKWSSRSKKPRKWAIRLGPISDGVTTGPDPTSADETTKLRWPVITLGNGSKSCRADFTFDLEGEGDRIKDVYLESGFSRQVEVVQVSEDPAIPDVLMFWGDIAGQKLSVNERGERVGIKATIEPYHFGDPCNGPEYRRPTGGHDATLSNDPIVFNPSIDDKIEGNRSSYSHEPATDQEHYYWIHPDSARTATARTIAQDGDTASLWTLADAVRTMAWLCNPDETYITNPSHVDFNNWMVNAPAVKNLELPTGRYLPDYLDLMLTPHGYGWTMTFKYDDADAKVVSYRIYKVNDDTASKVLQQKPGDTRGIRFTLTNVLDFDLETTIVSQANQITALGDYCEYEVTIELYRAWPEADDSLTAAGLTQSTGSDYPTHQRTWRLWVANEGGDYSGTRTTVAPIPSTPLSWNLSSVLGSDHLPRNLKAYDCLTHWKDDANGERKRQRPPYIEWYNTDNEWAALPDGWGETVLHDQLGVMFSADAPPAELIARGDDARIRITCTIRSEFRLISTASRSADSVNGRTNELIVDVRDRYKFRSVVSSGTYTSTLAGLPSSEARDDTTAIAAFAEKMRSVEDAAVVRGSITMIGIHPQFKIGQTLETIKGRDVSLNRMAKDVAAKKYLQITQITHDHQAQTTTLKVAPLLEELS